MSDNEWVDDLDTADLPYPRKGIILGVCRNFADDVGMPAWVTRVLFILVCFWLPIVMIVAYLVVFGLFYTKHPSARRRRQSVFKSRRNIRETRSRMKREAVRRPSPSQDKSVFNCRAKLNSVRESMHDCETRLRRIEKYVTSDRFRFDEEYRTLH